VRVVLTVRMVAAAVRLGWRIAVAAGARDGCRAGRCGLRIEGPRILGAPHRRRGRRRGMGQVSHGEDDGGGDHGTAQQTAAEPAGAEKPPGGGGKCNEAVHFPECGFV